jgi:site-specific DNA-adenine methylase
MAEWGIPYMGSKGSICNELVKIFPRATHFYDLFGGGFSVTHAMVVLRKNDFKHFHFNEIRPGICDLVRDAIDGKYSYDNFKPPFVDRDTFLKKKDSCFYTKIIWSFGNNGSSYLFSKEIEPYKKSMHNAIVFNELDELAREALGFEKFRDGFSVKDRRLFLRNKIEYYRKTKIPEVLHRFLNEKQLQQLQRLEQLERLQQLERLNFYSTSYENVKIEPDSIIYCDPPYAGTAEYDKNKSFDHKKFLDWADAQSNPVFISEYNIADKRFRAMFDIKKRSLLSSAGRKEKLEKVYVNKAAVNYLFKSSDNALQHNVT